MNPERFRGSPSGRVLQVQHPDGPYSAFIPAPLPPKLDMEGEPARLAERAAHALGELSGLGRILPNPYLLINPFIRREAVLSSRIEGTRADIADLYAYEAGQLPLPGMEAAYESDLREVMNYVRALEYGLKRLKQMPVSLRLIREVHQRLMTGVRGERAKPGAFRTVQTYIARAGCRGVHDSPYVPPPPEHLGPALDAFEKYLHAEEDPYPFLVRLAFSHYQFEAIHPFGDGNGRIGRLLIVLQLVEAGLLSQPLLYLSAYFERHRERYCDLLLAVSERGAWREWTCFFLEGVVEQARDAVARARTLQDLLASWKERLAGATRSASALRLVDNLLAEPVLTIPRVQSTLGVSYPAARHTVDKLVEIGILRQWRESSYARTYVAPEILEVLSRPHQPYVN